VLPLNLPIPGSFGLCVKILIIKKDEKQINTIPMEIFDKKSLKLP
jgi:hypothetical protein